MRDLYEVVKNPDMLRAEKYEKAVSVLGEMGLRELVDTRKKDSRHSDRSIFPETLERVINQASYKIEEGSYDKVHLQNLAEKEARLVWNEYLKAVYKKKYGQELPVSSPRKELTEEDLFPEV